MLVTLRAPVKTNSQRRNLKVVTDELTRKANGALRVSDTWTLWLVCEGLWLMLFV